jgi:hypothetical protein
VTIRPLLLIALLTLLLAGCGGSDGGDEPTGGTTTQEQTEALEPDEYVDELNAAQDEFVTAAGKLNLADPGSPEDFADSIESLGASADSLVSDLEALTPPEEVADLHDKLVSSMRDYSKTISDNVEGLRSGDKAQIQSAATKIGEASTSFSTTFQSTVTDINDELGKTTP